MPLPVAIVTLFPEMFAGWLEHGGVARARGKGLIDITFVNPRRWGIGPHLQVDDYPFGGGAGMVLRPEPVFGAVESIENAGDGPIILLSPRGRPFTQSIAHELVGSPRLTFIAGHYEGVDERVSEHLVTDEVSIGDYVLSGGEPAAMAVVDAIARLLPGAIDSESVAEESFVDNLLEYPQYTRPAEFRSWEVPEVLISGHHANIARWRREQSAARTLKIRPDLRQTDRSDAR